MPKDRAETAQLQREIVGVVAHDLGSIAGALALRAELPAPVDTAAYARQQAAMRELTRQLRGAMQLLELARVGAGPRLGNTTKATTSLAPSVLQADWCEQLRVLARAALPRGDRFTVHLPENAVPDSVPAHDIAILTQLVQAAWQGLHVPRSVGQAPFSIELSLDSSLVMTVTVAADLMARITSANKWRRFSERLAREIQYQFVWWHVIDAPDADHVVLRWTCVRDLPDPA